jgi:hypothetical protein
MNGVNFEGWFEVFDPKGNVFGKIFLHLSCTAKTKSGDVKSLGLEKEFLASPGQPTWVDWAKQVASLPKKITAKTALLKNFLMSSKSAPAKEV